VNNGALFWLPELVIKTVIAPPPRYFHGLDELRAALMLIGVFWHAAAVLSPFAAFVYASPYHQSMPLYATIYPEHLFRMEAFFLVSGFLAQMTLARKDKRIFWQARLRRVLLPLLLGCLGVNFILQVFGSIFMEYQWAHYDFWRWVMHGWFLICLMTFAGVDMLLPRGVFARMGILPCILVATIGWLGYAALIYWNGESWHLGGDISTLFNFFILHGVQYYPFYFAGALLYYHQDILERVRVLSPSAFEQLVVDVLLAMGYGGSEGRGMVTQVSNDGGIDGVIDQDALGLSKIYVQAKHHGEKIRCAAPRFSHLWAQCTGRQHRACLLPLVRLHPVHATTLKTLAPGYP